MACVEHYAFCKVKVPAAYAPPRRRDAWKAHPVRGTPREHGKF